MSYRIIVSSGDLSLLEVRLRGREELPSDIYFVCVLDSRIPPLVLLHSMSLVVVAVCDSKERKVAGSSPNAVSLQDAIFLDASHFLCKSFSSSSSSQSIEVNESRDG